MLRGVQLRSVYIYAAWFKASRILHNMCIDVTGAEDVVDPEDGDDRIRGQVSGCDREAAASNELDDKAFIAVISVTLAKRAEFALQKASLGLSYSGSRGRIPL